MFITGLQGTLGDWDPAFLFTPHGEEKGFTLQSSCTNLKLCEIGKLCYFLGNILAAVIAFAAFQSCLAAV